jgi:hypothetical protein
VDAQSLSGGPGVWGGVYANRVTFPLTETDNGGNASVRYGKRARFA